MTKEEDIVYENGNHWVFKTGKGTYEVYKIGATCSTRCGIIGIKGEEGLQQAIRECDKRANAE